MVAAGGPHCVHSLFESDYELYTIKPDGTDARRLTSEPGNDAHRSRSPDGQWLAFASARRVQRRSGSASWKRTAVRDIYVMRADGSDVRQLTDTPFRRGYPGVGTGA